MHDDPHLVQEKVERRVQAVLALFQGESVARVRARFGICRSDLYKFKRRAAVALRQAVQDQSRGPHSPRNRLPPLWPGGSRAGGSQSSCGHAGR